ncbi:formylmethanofuran dehydrogenase [Methanocalculus chunghsingensis]|uniref:Formylmethanofuran dehydrogenase n=1 Tax=Methanocalculus chunghsingensis TaxID=156457 RepID=A0A8J7W7H0_9EURY|nr:FmdE family protein [Methanocalculus chunghsingensis]MBR1368933.1 formylmethanofuran dehydrogenase [Methanocalculus chunghsingensis]
MCETHDHQHFEATGKYPEFEECVKFHGHSCPGLATGYRAALAAMQALGVARPYDEELVTVAETDACGLDAIQLVTGCTAGKGNLIINDYGKHAFSFYAREKGKGVRILIKNRDMPGKAELDGLRKKVFGGSATETEQKRFYELMAAATDALLLIPQDELLTVVEIAYNPPQKARIFATVTCPDCGEPVADGKMRTVDGKTVCIPCSLASRQ